MFSCQNGWRVADAPQASAVSTILATSAGRAESGSDDRILSKAGAVFGQPHDVIGIARARRAHGPDMTPLSAPALCCRLGRLQAGPVAVGENQHVGGARQRRGEEGF